MSKTLIVVESPAKIKTIKKYLPKNFEVAATYGHIMDLPKKEIGIDVDDNFAVKYVIINEKKAVVRKLKAEAAKCDQIYLAPDPDREGEAIAAHVVQILKKKDKVFKRILFNELTKNGIQNALKEPTSVDENKYNAQQARRILDRLVGYLLSPLLWNKVKRGLSAGRVQSVAVRLICERERQIYQFVPEEYWTITAKLKDKDDKDFEAKLIKKNDKKIKISNKEEADTVLKDLKAASFVVDKIQKKTINRNPFPPFITSTLQQDAINRLRFSAKKTMQIAQMLYEGVSLGKEGHEGLITYVRTDSVRVSDEAISEANLFISKNFGKEYCPPKARYYKNKKKAQDAHEAIRPTSVLRAPDKIKSFLSKDQFLLYDLIWKRFMASQMSSAKLSQNTSFIKADNYLFSITSSSLVFEGFLKVYQTSLNNDADDLFLNIAEKDILKSSKIIPKQHFTKAPPRFSEASLVKELEENGVGRPSTYASILSAIRNKGYVDFENRYFKAKELGMIVTDLLVESFPKLFDVNFTAKMEDDLDKVSMAKLNFLDLLKKFFQPFKKDIETANDKMLSLKKDGIETDLKCPTCGSNLNIKIGRNGEFLTCSKYPECTFSSNYMRDEKGDLLVEKKEAEETTDELCSSCNSPMLVKYGRYGKFLACSAYPKCKNTLSLNQNAAVDTKIKCPNKGCSGTIVEKRTKKGKIFYGCSKYPDCTFATWYKPVDQKCPVCNSTFLLERESKKEGKYLTCPNEDCSYRRDL